MQQSNYISAFLNFPLPPNKLCAITDANWGPQDPSEPDLSSPPKHLDIFNSRSVSGYILWLNGPFHWISKRQFIAARSSTESEIYATDECVNILNHIANILEEMDLKEEFMSAPISVYNNNQASINWYHSMTTKGIRHLQMCNNAVREDLQTNFARVKHV